MSLKEKRKGALKDVGLVFGVLLVLYVGSYLGLSLRGRFEPWVATMAGVQLYAWAPEGFVHGGKWNAPLVLFYLPVMRLDWAFWHQSARFPDSRYPIDAF